MGCCLPWERLNSFATGRTIRVLTCNVNGHDADMGALTRLVNEANADVVALQQCYNLRTMARGSTMSCTGPAGGAGDAGWGPTLAGTIYL